MKKLSYGRQFIDKADIKEVVKAVGSDWLSQGPRIKEFEEILAGYCGAKYAVAVSSGTAALHVACLAAGLKKGYEAITTPVTFLATSNSIVYSGAKPVFADIDYDTFNIDPLQIRKQITSKTRAILPVHFAGLPCNMKALYKIAKDNGLSVIEDGCHALGAEYLYGGKRYMVGSSRHSDMTVFSFHPVKTITTGEGGAVTTNDPGLYKKLLALRSHGIYRSDDMTKENGPWYYEMRELGFNYRITDFQCALGISQLKKIGSFLKRREEIASMYDHAFSGLPNVKIPTSAAGNGRHAYHIYVLRINFNMAGIDRKRFMGGLNSDGILTQVHYIPVYRHPYYKKIFDLNTADFPNSERYYEEAVSIPVYPLMTDRDVRRVIVSINKVLGL